MVWKALNPFISSVTAMADGLESFESLHVISDGHGAGSLDDRLDGHHFSSQLHGLGKLLGARVSLPGLLRVDGEEDQLALVLLQTLGVELQRLNTLVLSAVIHSNTDGLGVLFAKTSSLQFFKGESLAGPDLDVVFVGGAVDSRPQLTQGPGSDAGSLGHTGLVTAELPGGLVEPGLDIVLPVLMEMPVWDELVPF